MTDMEMIRIVGVSSWALLGVIHLADFIIKVARQRKRGRR